MITRGILKGQSAASQRSRSGRPVGLPWLSGWRQWRGKRVKSLPAPAVRALARLAGGENSLFGKEIGNVEGGCPIPERALEFKLTH